jgi:hypothetical protein
MTTGNPQQPQPARITAPYNREGNIMPENDRNKKQKHTMTEAEYQLNAIAILALALAVLVYITCA